MKLNLIPGKVLLIQYPQIVKLTMIIMGISSMLTFTQCSKEDPVTVPPTETDVHFLGHKGGGNNDANPNHIENTIPSVQDGLKTMNGVEVDLQMSLDGTIWMYHDPDLNRFSCTSGNNQCILLMTDAEIEKVQICDGGKHDRIYKLDELVNLWNTSAGGFEISMEVKLDFPEDTMNSPLIGGEAAYLLKMGDQMDKLFPTVKYPDQLLIEVYDAKFCTRMHSLIPEIKICLLKSVTFQQQIKDALALGYDGVSCSFDEETLNATEVKRAQDNGLIVQVWTPDSKEELTKALEYHPNYIQTNNLDAISLLNLTVK